MPFLAALHEIRALLALCLQLTRTALFTRVSGILESMAVWGAISKLGSAESERNVSKPLRFQC